MIRVSIFGPIILLSYMLPVLYDPIVFFPSRKPLVHYTYDTPILAYQYDSPRTTMILNASTPSLNSPILHPSIHLFACRPRSLQRFILNGYGSRVLLLSNA